MKGIYPHLDDLLERKSHKFLAYELLKLVNIFNEPLILFIFILLLFALTLYCLFYFF